MRKTSSKPWPRSRTSASPASAKSPATSKSKSPSKLPALLQPKAAARRLSRVQKLALLEVVFARLAEAMPDPRCELYFTSDFQLLLSVVLSAQTTDKMVNASMREVYDQGFGPEDILRLGEKGMLQLIRRIGLAPTKAKRAVELAHQILTKHDGAVPSTREELEALPGVGRKTANVVLAELHRAPTLAVDTHVFRVTRRLGLHTAKTPEKCEQELMALVDPKYLPAAHHWFILHGRYTCKAIKPLCGGCVLKDVCPSVI